MRSRYSAFAVGDEAYLTHSWHPSTRPQSIDLESDLRWTRLEVLASTGGGPFHTEGTVEFQAHYIEAGRAGVLHENSFFERVDNRWVYVRPNGRA
jgi:SEC-C motif-containing protein